MLETGRAAVLTSYNEILEVREYPLPDTEPGALVVKVECATICGTDVHAWEGMLAANFDIKLPVILGHEMAGQIISIGEGADTDSVSAPLAVGDRIVWAPEACGHCYYCTVEKAPTLCTNRRYGYMQNCDQGVHFHGGFAEYAYVPPAASRLRIPDGVKSEWASASSCALRSVINAWERLGVVDYRHTVVIQGAGPVGLFATALAAVHSPKQIIVIGGPDDRLEIAREWGANATVSVEKHTDAASRLECVHDLTGGRGGDVVGEFSGARGALGEGIELCAVNARYLVVGTIGGAPQEIPAAQIALKNLSLFGSVSGGIDSYYNALMFMDKYKDRFDWDLMMGNSYGLEEVTMALSKMQRFEEIKAVIKPSERLVARG